MLLVGKWNLGGTLGQKAERVCWGHLTASDRWVCAVAMQISCGGRLPVLWESVLVFGTVPLSMQQQWGFMSPACSQGMEQRQVVVSVCVGNATDGETPTWAVLLKSTSNCSFSHSC